MAIDIGRLGGAGIVHRFMDKKEQLLNMMRIERANRDNKFISAPIIPAIGVGSDELSRLEYLLNGLASVDAIAIDIANGHSSLMKSMIQSVSSITDEKIPIIAGNVATGDGLAFLADCGVSSVRVGIGGGSICKTRIMTGYGLPTLTSIALCDKARMDGGYSDVTIIADGGIRYPSDMVKSIAAGADLIMCGRVLAGTGSSPGDVVSVNDKRFKLYRGMASSEAQLARGTGLKPGTCSEGVSTHIEYSGELEDVLSEFVGGIRSGMTYAGVSNLSDLKNNAIFSRVSASSLDESHAFGTKNKGV
tara:strand:- start:316 stop:1227 length:912 start_codon:yes stop_codon:yes gene_type:complete